MDEYQSWSRFRLLSQLRETFLRLLGRGTKSF